MPLLTADFINDIKSPASGQVLYRDDDTPGFGLRVTANCKAYIIECRVDGSVKRITIGRHGRITLEDARKEAARLLHELTAGKKTAAISGQTSAPTLAEVLESYVTSKRLRASTVVSYRQVITLHLSGWLDLPVNEINQHMVFQRHKELGEKLSHSTANLVMTVLRAVLYFAANQDRKTSAKPWEPAATSAAMPQVNPVSKLSQNQLWYRKKRRQGVIPDHKLSDWYRAVMNCASVNVRDYLLLLTTSGLRRNEACTLKWSSVDFELRVLRIPADRAKNHREHLLPLSQFHMMLLARRKAESGDSEYVFPGRLKGHMVSYIRGITSQVVEQARCPFTLHDCRRTFVSMAAKLGVQHHLTKRLLNHIGDKDDTDEYIVISTEHLREPMELISKRFLELMGADFAYWNCNKSVYRPVTLAEVLDRYLEEKPMKQTSARSYRNTLKQRLPDWMSLPVTAITPEMVEQRHRQISTVSGAWKASKVQANFTMSVLNTLLNWVSEHYEVDGKPLLKANPVRVLWQKKQWNQIPPRRSVILEEDLPALYKAMQAATARTPAALFLLVLLTGLRLRSARTLKVSDINFADRTLTVRAENSVNRREHCIPLGDFVLSLLAERTADSHSQYVFPGRAGTYCKQFSEVQEGIKQASGVTFTPDMLRRTFFDVALRIGVPSYALSAFANETRGQSATTLALMGDMERLREPMQLISDKLLELVEVALQLPGEAS